MAEIENLKIGSGGTIHIVGNEDIVAEAWAAGQSYVKDKSYVINNHILYVCNTSHTSTSPFDPTNWTVITVGESLTSLFDAINDVIATSKLNPVYGNEASGAIATFDTSLALPLQNLQIAINAVQESGTPTPSSPKLISGFTGANIKVAGNLLNENKYQFSYNTVMLGESAGNTYSTHLKATTYTISFKRPTSVPFKVYYNKSGGSAIDIMTYGQTTSASFTVAEEGDYRFVAYYHSGAVAPTDITEIMLVGGSEVKPYKAYTTPTTTAITWQDEAGTVYGGSLDVTSGVLTVTWYGMTLNTCTPIYNSTNLFFGYYNSSSTPSAVFPKRHKLLGGAKCECYAFDPDPISSITQIPSKPDKTIYCTTTGNLYIKDTDYTDTTSFLNAVGSYYLIYEMETPEVYQLTPTQITAIVGTNNVFTDTNGDTSVVYACSLKDYIDGQ